MEKYLFVTKPEMRIWHVWRDDEGISHQNLRSLDSFSLKSFIAGIPGIWQSQPSQGTGTIVFLHLVPGQEYGWHENPAPQWIVPISGHWFVETMDGTRVEMGPGDISFGADQGCLLVEGKKGHRSGAVGSDPAMIMLVQVKTDPFSQN